MLFDLIFAIVFAAAGAVLTATLAFTLAHTARGRLIAAGAVSAWFVAVLAIGAAGIVSPQGGLGVPGLGLAVLTSTATLSWLLLKADRRDEGAQPATPLLIAVHAIRVLGVSLVLLHLAHRLPAPFATSAGWGDIAIGLTAAPVAWLAGRGGGRVLAITWNLLGCLDLIAAIGLGATSSPGPIRLFLEPPGAALMTTLPWILIPCFLVPGLFALHLTILARLRRDEAAARTPLPLSAHV